MNSELLSTYVILFAVFLVSSFPRVCDGQELLETSDFERLRKVITADDATADQIESAVQENTGKRVKWRGWVELVRDDASVVVDMDKPDVFWSMQDVELLDLPSYVAGELERDNEITFSGRIAKLFNGPANSLQVRIEDAALEGEFAVDKQTAEKRIEQEREALIEWYEKYSGILDELGDKEEMSTVASLAVKPGQGQRVTQSDIETLKSLKGENAERRDEMDGLEPPELSKVDAQAALEQAIEDYEFANTAWGTALESLIDFLYSPSREGPTKAMSWMKITSDNVEQGLSQMRKVAEAYDIPSEIMP